jgi:hypothetical protein
MMNVIIQFVSLLDYLVVNNMYVLLLIHGQILFGFLLHRRNPILEVLLLL